jgi:hypothetical protein
MIGMKKIASTLFVSFMACAVVAGAADEKAAPATGTGIGQHIPAFKAQLLDAAAGTPRPATDFDSQRQNRITAYVFVGTHCPATQAYAERLAALDRGYAPKKVDFVYIYPNREDTLDAKLEFHQQKHLQGRLIDDRGGAIAKQFGAQRTSEIVLTDAHGTVVYHGAIDDSRDPKAVKEHYLQTALDQTLAGKPVTTATTDVQA